MLQNLTANKWYMFFLTILLAISISLLINNVVYIFSVVLFFFIIFTYRIEIIPLIIGLLLVFVSDINVNLRNVITLLSVFVTVIYFLKEYGLMYKLYPIFPRKFEYYIIFLITIMFLSSIFSSSIMDSLGEVIKQVFFFVFIYFLYALIRNDRDIFNYINALIAAGTILALSIIFNLLYTEIPIQLLRKGVIQEGGLLDNVSAAGGILSVVISLSFALMLSLNEKKTKRWYIVLFIIQVIGLLLTNSRAAILGTILSISFIHYFLAREYIKRTVFVIILSIGPFLFFFRDFFVLILLYLRVDRVFENTRFFLWDIAIDIFKDNPFFGAGPGMFKVYIYEFLPVRLDGWDEQQIEWIYSNVGVGHAHNFFLFYLSELGIFGLIAAILLPILYFTISFRVLQVLKKDSRLYAVVIGIIGLGIGLFARAFFESTGLFTYGWITRDLPFGVCFIIILYLYNKLYNVKHATKINN